MLQIYAQSTVEMAHTTPTFSLTHFPDFVDFKESNCLLILQFLNRVDLEIIAINSVVPTFVHYTT